MHKAITNVLHKRYQPTEVRMTERNETWKTHAGKTLETLFHSLGDDDADNNVSLVYSAARTSKVQEISEYISGFLNNPLVADEIAEDIMSSAEEMGRIDGNSIGGEVSSRYTSSGNPLPFTI